MAIVSCISYLRYLVVLTSFMSFQMYRFEADSCIVSSSRFGERLVAHSPNIHLEHPSPPIPTLWIEKVDPDTTSRPTPSFKFTPISPLHKDVQFFRIGVDPIIVRSLDVGVYDRYHLVCQSHFRWSGGRPAFLNFLPTAANMPTGSGNRARFQSKYLLSVVYSTSSHVTSSGISCSSNLASTSRTSASST